MKLSEIIHQLQAVQAKHGDLFFYLETMDSDDGSALVANDFVGVEVTGLAEEPFCLMTLETHKK